MRRCLRLALGLLVGVGVGLGIAACSGGGSGAPSGPGTPIALGGSDPVPPPRDNPGPGRESPTGSSGGQGSSSGGPAGCPCAGVYTCGGVGFDGGAATVTLTATGNTCNWSSTGTPIQLGCNGMTSVQGYSYTSSWSGGSIQLCINTGSQGGQTCITCNPGG